MSVKKTFVDGNTLTAADANTYLQNQGTEPIATQTFSGVGTVTFLNCFSATYTSYMVVFENFTQSASGSGVYMLFGNNSGGSFVPNSTNYSYKGILNSGTVGVYNNAGTNQAIASTATSTSRGGQVMFIQNPFVSAYTSWQSNWSEGFNNTSWFMAGIHGVASSFNSLSFPLISGNQSGTIKIYGMV